MKSDGFLKHAFVAFVLALVVYILAYSGIEAFRTRNGPWQVTFTNAPSGAAAMFVAEPMLGIANVQFIFPGATNVPAAGATNQLALEQPREVPFDVPFGRCVFLDLTSLPGTMVFEVFGHEIQLLPRVLTIDGTEQAWRPEMVITLVPTNRPAPALPRSKP